MAAEREIIYYGRNIRCIEQCILTFYMLITSSYVERYLYIFLGVSLRRLLALACLSVRPLTWNNSAPTGRIFKKIWHLSVFRKYVEKILGSLKSYKNEYFTWRPTYIYGTTSSVPLIVRKYFQVVQKIKTHVSCSIVTKIVPFMR